MPYEKGKPWTFIVKGNVVKWMGDHYVVAKATDKGLDLLPFRYSNSSAHPTETWPEKGIYLCPEEYYEDEAPEDGKRLEPCGECRACDSGYPAVRMEPDKTKTVETVKVVARTVEDFIMGKMKKMMDL